MRLLALSLLACVSVEGRPPNFVVFLTDDLGYGDVGSYGHPTIRTSNIDLLPRDGLRFTQFYSGYMICTPSRSSLLTGRLPVRDGIFSKAKIFRVFLPDSVGGLPQDEITIPKLLKQANYSPSQIGKWHLGHLHSLPTQRGFDKFYGLPYAQDEGCPPSCPADLLWHGVPLYDGEKIVEQPVNLSTLTPRYNAEDNGPSKVVLLESSFPIRERDGDSPPPLFHIDAASINSDANDNDDVRDRPEQRVSSPEPDELALPGEIQLLRKPADT